jgi:hypothetical protein
VSALSDVTYAPPLGEECDANEAPWSVVCQMFVLFLLLLVVVFVSGHVWVCPWLSEPCFF